MLNPDKVQQVIEKCVNKELESYSVTYDEVKIGGDKEFFVTMRLESKKYFFGLLTKSIMQPYKIPWYQYFTFKSEQEFESWKAFCINVFRKDLKLTKKQAIEEFNWFNLKWGLKENYEH